MRNKILIWLLPVVSSLLWWLSYHPANLSFVIWFALVPFFFYIFIESNRKRFLVICWLNGFVFYLLGLFWLRHVTIIGLIVLAFILAFYQVLFGLIAKFIKDRYGVRYYFWLTPLIWISLEYLRSFLFTGFPWFFLGHTQYRWISFIQTADIAGVYSLSFIIALVNSLIAWVLLKWTSVRTQLILKQKLRILFQEWSLVGFGILAIMLIAFALIYGSFKEVYITKSVQNGPCIGIIQGNIEQSLKSTGDEAYNIYRKHLQLSLSLIKGHGNSTSRVKPDLIVWPETMYPYPIGFYEGNLESLQETAQRCQIPMLIGVITHQKSKETDEIDKMFNSAYYLKPDGVVIGRYDKIHLVPIGEYLPLKNMIPGLESFVTSLSAMKKLYQLSPGKNVEPMSLGNKRFGVLICYESIFPKIVRQSVQKGADFIINISNDGWFKNSAELDQMLTISLFRCVENKISLIRATNTGISAFISPLGELNILRNAAGHVKAIEGTMVAPVLIAFDQTFYSKYGDFFPQGCMFLMAVIILLKFLKIT